MSISTTWRKFADEARWQALLACYAAGALMALAFAPFDQQRVALHGRLRCRCGSHHKTDCSNGNTHSTDAQRRGVIRTQRLSRAGCSEQNRRAQHGENRRSLTMD